MKRTYSHAKRMHLKNPHGYRNLLWVAASAAAGGFTVFASLSRVPAEVTAAVCMAVISLVLAMSTWNENPPR